MKKLLYIIAAVLLVASCRKEPGGGDTPVDPVLKEFGVDCSIAQEDARAAIDAKTLQVLWQENDRIGLVDMDGKITEAVLKHGAGSANGQFTYKAAEELDIKYAYYPYKGEESFRGSQLSIAIAPQQQSAQEGLVAQNTLLMTASKVQNAFEFTAASAVIELNLTGLPSDIENIEISTQSGKLSGAGIVNMAASSRIFAPGTSAQSSVSLACNLHLSDTPVKAYLVVPETTISDLTILASGSQALSYTSSLAIQTHAGKILPISVSLDVPASATVFGKVLCDGAPVEGVILTDGYEFATTDSKGLYYLASEKKNGLVWMTIPRGYTVQRGYGALPQFYQHTAKAATDLERLDFTLVEDGDQTNHTMFLLGDVHLMNGNNDLYQYKKFTEELNAAHAANPRSYAIQLGDSTWDFFWYSSGHYFTMDKYLQQSDQIAFPLFNTMGNHDGDMYDTDDWTYGRYFRKFYGPTCYSMNIGDIHYIILDDVITTNDGTGRDGRDYHFGISDPDMEWLKKDLSYVSKTTPVLVMMHIPMFNAAAKDANWGAPNMSTSDFMKPFAGYNVRLFSAHSHTVYNNYGKWVNGMNVIENNVGSVCGDFWSSGVRNEYLRMGRDGSPAGYRVLEVNGTECSTYFKVSGHENYMFRAYDRDQIDINADKYCPNGGAKHKTEFNKYTEAFAGPSDKHYVYICIWDKQPGWNIKVTENGKALTVTQDTGYDPLYMISTMAAKCNDSASDASFVLDMYPVANYGRYRVTASSATSTLVITVTDNCGHSQTEVMKRPKQFSLDVYAEDFKDDFVTAPVWSEDDQIDL